MNHVSVAQAKSRLSEVLARVEGGEEIIVTRRGRPVACLTPIASHKRKLDLERLDAFRARQRSLATSSADIVRRMRDEDY